MCEITLFERFERLFLRHHSVLVEEQQSPLNLIIHLVFQFIQLAKYLLIQIQNPIIYHLYSITYTSSYSNFNISFLDLFSFLRLADSQRFHFIHQNISILTFLHGFHIEIIEISNSSEGETTIAKLKAERILLKRNKK